MTHPIPGADSEREDLVFRLSLAQNAACSCLTKTPEIAFHDSRCLYRVLGEAINKLSRAAAKVGANVAADDLLNVIRIVREHPNFDDETSPMAQMMDEALAGKKPSLVDALASLAEGRKPTDLDIALTAYDRRIAAGAPAETPKPESKDWPEDFAHENGNYQNRCSACGGLFMGHKRRVTCKKCATQPAPIAGDVEKDAARLDWLDSTNAKFRMGWQVGCAPVGNVSVKSIIAGGTTIRAAIDAAMLANSSSGEAG